MEQIVIVAGIGCRSGVSAEQVISALDTALGAPAASGWRVARIATAATRSAEPAIAAAALARGVPVVSVPQPDLEAASSRTVTRSAASMKALNVHSVAEAAALAAAGPTSTLLAARVVVGPVTCALAGVSEKANI